MEQQDHTTIYLYSLTKDHGFIIQEYQGNKANVPLCNNDFEEVQKEDNYLKGDALGLSSVYHFTEWLQMKSCTDMYDSKRMYPTGFGGQLTFLLALHFYFFVKHLNNYLDCHETQLPDNES